MATRKYTTGTHGVCGVIFSVTRGAKLASGAPTVTLSILQPSTLQEIDQRRSNKPNQAWCYHCHGHHVIPVLVQRLQVGDYR